MAEAKEWVPRIEVQAYQLSDLLCLMQMLTIETARRLNREPSRRLKHYEKYLELREMPLPSLVLYGSLQIMAWVAPRFLYYCLCVCGVGMNSPAQG